METVLIEIKNNKALKLIEDLEDLQLIKVLKKIKDKVKLSEKYAGKLPQNIADEMQNYVSKSREEWNKNSL
jgi:hypothetical protein